MVKIQAPPIYENSVYLYRFPSNFPVDLVGKTGGAQGKRVGLSVGKRARVPWGYVQVLYDIQMNVLSVGKWKEN